MAKQSKARLPIQLQTSVQRNMMDGTLWEQRHFSVSWAERTLDKATSNTQICILDFCIWLHGRKISA
jgi:hypothetical protein